MVKCRHGEHVKHVHDRGHRHRHPTPPYPNDAQARQGARLALFVTGGGGLPPRIHLFQRNLERFAVDREELQEEIAVTLYHELGHYLGLDEEELEELDLA